mmetsp:Transcript_91871/g.249304  ORF Transcript_91871/g.249304 Transcript_91871/m.249304 type:complete len:219 (-) Transcript_91871:287-943(-)
MRIAGAAARVLRLPSGDSHLLSAVALSNLWSDKRITIADQAAHKLGSVSTVFAVDVDCIPCASLLGVFELVTHVEASYLTTLFQEPIERPLELHHVAVPAACHRGIHSVDSVRRVQAVEAIEVAPVIGAQCLRLPWLLVAIVALLGRDPIELFVGDGVGLRVRARGGDVARTRALRDVVPEVVRVLSKMLAWRVHGSDVPTPIYEATDCVVALHHIAH